MKPVPKSLNTRNRNGTIWRELANVCRTVHVYLHKKQDRQSAQRYESRLQRILDRLPDNDLAILREEGAALLHELRCESASAIKHRKREIRLIERLHDSVQESVAVGDYDERMAASILAGHDEAMLDERRAILRRLELQVQQRKGCRVPRSDPKKRRGKVHK